MIDDLVQPKNALHLKVDESLDIKKRSVRYEKRKPHKIIPAVFLNPSTEKRTMNDNDQSDDATTNILLLTSLLRWSVYLPSKLGFHVRDADVKQ